MTPTANSEAGTVAVGRHKKSVSVPGDGGHVTRRKAHTAHQRSEPVPGAGGQVDRPRRRVPNEASKAELLGGALGGNWFWMR